MKGKKGNREGEVELVVVSDAKSAHTFLLADKTTTHAFSPFIHTPPLIPSLQSQIADCDMASLTAAALSVPSFSGLRADQASVSKQGTRVGNHSLPAAALHRGNGLSVSASLFTESARKAASATAVAVAAALIVATPAMAAKVEVGSEDGSFLFSPDNITVAAGEQIEFTLVGETGHNVVFDVDGSTPPAVADELRANSMDENDLLTEDEPTFSAKISTPGTYTYYCTPHRSANMKGSITVK